MVARLRGERGTTLVDGLIGFVLVGLVLLLAVQTLLYAHARSVAIAAAQDGARAAAAAGPDAGVQRADNVLALAGRTGDGLHATVADQAQQVTVSVDGQAPSVFLLGLVLPAVHASASLPLEQYDTAEQAP